MSRGLNRAQVIGYLGQDPDLRHTAAGTAVCNLRIATDESYTDDDGNRQKRAEWHTVVCWAGLAETVAEYLEKGSRVFVEGPMQTRTWEDADGVEQSQTQIKATDVTFLDSRGSSGGSEQQSQKQPAGGFQSEDDLPF